MNEVFDTINYNYRHCYSDGAYDIYQKETTDGKFLCFCMTRKYTFINTPMIEYHEGFEKFGEAYKFTSKRRKQVNRQKQPKNLMYAYKKKSDE